MEKPKEVLDDGKKHLDKRSAERALRDAGFSRKESEKIVAKGFHDEGEPHDDVVNSTEGEPQKSVDEPQGEPAKAVILEEPKQERHKDRTADILTRAEMASN